MMDENNPAQEPARAPEACPPHGAPQSLQIERGTCHALLAYDVALSINLDEAEQRITAMKQRKSIRHRRRLPAHFEYDPPPLRVTQEIEPLAVGGRRTEATVDLMIFDFGAVSVSYRIPLAGPLSDLLALSDELYDNPVLQADARRRVEWMLETIGPAAAKPAVSELVEDYAIHEIEAVAPALSPEKLVAGHADLLARILRAETGPLSAEEVREALSSRLSFGGDDLLVVDWNAAILFDTEADDVRAVLEFANIELLEMRYLDDQLDDALNESHETLARQRWRGRSFFSSSARELQRIAELQMDAALLFEGVHNAIKLLGDQYLARVHRSAAQRMHVPGWEGSILRKLQTLESIYQKVSDHHSTWRMEVLEWIIIILIALSIVLSFFPGWSTH